MPRACSRFVSFILIGLTVCWGSVRADAAPGPRSTPIAGPVRGDVLRVIDADTLEIEAFIWPDHRVVTSVRVEGIDTPELKGKCDQERDLAIRAKDFVTSLLDTYGPEIRLVSVRHDKYAGRVVAVVILSNGEDLGGRLLLEGLARPYDGKAKVPWCPTVATQKEGR